MTISPDSSHEGCLNCDGDGRILEDHDGRAGYRRCTKREIRCPACRAFPYHAPTCRTRTMTAAEVKAFFALPWREAAAMSGTPMAKLVVSADGKTVDVDRSCKVCGAKPDATGCVTHGRGCYRINADGGGVEYVDFEERARSLEPAPTATEERARPEPATPPIEREERARSLEPATLNASTEERARPSEPATDAVGHFSPALYPIAGTHVAPEAVDGDVDALATKFTAITAEIGGLIAECLRVRDENRSRLDALARELTAVKQDRDDARRDYQDLALKFRDALGRINALELERDDLQRQLRLK